MVYDEEERLVISKSSGKMEPNFSPVNFFKFDYNLYPLLADIETRYTVVLRSGDCMYIPAFYFH